jgi:hypothetical protein
MEDRMKGAGVEGAAAEEVEEVGDLKIRFPDKSI